MSFKDKSINWTEVTTSSMLPAGGYVAVITNVEDVESGSYLLFTYDIAEGPCKGFFSGDDRVYVHQFKRWYTDKAESFMKRFLHFVEESNDDFKLEGWDNDIADLVGKLVGIVVQRTDYTNKSGEDRARMDVEAYASADDIRKGRYTVPEPKDTRSKRDEGEQPVQDSVYDADIPF